MSKILQVYIDDETEKRLEYSMKDLGMTMEWLAEAAVSETALNATKHLDDKELGL